MQKKRILLVDDQKPATHLWKTLLELTGTYLVQEENRGSRAIQTARAFGPDLIVLDVNMPDLDGGEVALHVTRDEQLKHTPILFMTSLVSDFEVAAGKRIEGFPVVAKPTTFDGLVLNIEKHLACNRKRFAQTVVELAA